MFDLFLLYAPVVWLVVWLLKSMYRYWGDGSGWVWATYNSIEKLMDEADRDPLAWTTIVSVVAYVVYVIGSPTVFLAYICYFICFNLVMFVICEIIDETTGVAKCKPKK